MVSSTSPPPSPIRSFVSPASATATGGGRSSPGCSRSSSSRSSPSSVGVKQISSFRLPGTESQRAYDLLAEHFPAAKGDTDQLVFKARSGTLKRPRAPRRGSRPR